MNGQTKNFYEFGPFRFDSEERTLLREGFPIALPPRVAETLFVLLEDAGYLVEKEKFMKGVWPDAFVEEGNLNKNIFVLRKTLGQWDGGREYIETVPKRGYRFVAPVRHLRGVAVPEFSPPKGTYLIGRKVSHYRILELLGGGGMGLVYKAEDLKLGRRVALKFLPEELASDSVALERFEREARAASALNHPNICTVYAIEEHDNQPFIAMELLEGESLRDLIASASSSPPSRQWEAPLRTDKLLDVAIQVSQGLDAAHRKGIIHRDIKPANVFLTTQGQAKVLDFGLAKLQESEELQPAPLSEGQPKPKSFSSLNVTRTGVAIGTVGYMSPEQVRGEKLDSRTDLFSFGLVLYEMATGQKAFVGDTAAVLREAILKDSPKPIRVLNAKSPTELEGVINKMLEKDRETRYQTASEIGAELQELKSKIAKAALSPDSVTEDLRGGSKITARSRWFWTAAVLIIVFGLAGILAWFTRPLSSPRVLNTIQITHDGLTKTGVLTDGSRLYITESTGSRQFLVQASATVGDTSVIPTPFSNIIMSDVSADHSQMLVADAVGTENEAQAWVLPLPAGAPRRLADVVASWDVWASQGWAAWSPDGRELAFAKGSDIFMASADGTNARRIITLSGYASEIRFSPDATHLRFSLRSLQNNRASSIWDIRTDGTSLHPMLPGWHTSFSTMAGDWSRDGRYYFFTSCRDSNSCSIWAIREVAGLFNRRASPPVALTIGPMPVYFNGLSSDGKKIFAGGWMPRSELVRYDARTHQFRAFLDGISADEVDFSPDGKWVAYVSNPDRTLWRSHVDGSERVQLTSPPASVLLPRWSPDGTEIVYVDENAGPFWRIFLISAQGGTPRPLLAENQHQLGGSWSPDGRQLVFGRVPWLERETEKIAIQLFDLGSRQVSTVSGSSGLFAPRWSPDGQHLAALSIDGRKLLLFDFKTKRWRDWIHEPGAIGYPTWSRDGAYIYYDNTSTNDPTYRRVKIGQTRSEFVIDLKGLHRTLDPDATLLGPWSGLAPDGTVFFGRNLTSDEIYSLEVELP